MSRRSSARVRIAQGGRLVIPAEFRRSIGLEIGQEALLELNDGVLMLMHPRQAIRRAQALVRKTIPSDVSLVDELLAQRRAEAAGE